jgi:hypothetical protein
MTQRYADFFPERVNCRVPSMSGLGQLDDAGEAVRLDFGAPATAGIVYGPSAAQTTGVVNTFSNLGISVLGTSGAARWGRGLTIEASAASTRTFNVRGRDFLGQRMSFSGTMNGTTPVDIPKAFAYIDEIVMGASADVTTITVKTTDKMGVPYKLVALIASLEDGVTATAATLVTGINVAATGTNGDTRGTLDFNSANNGTKTFSALVLLDGTNLHGNAQFYS